MSSGSTWFIPITCSMSCRIARSGSVCSPRVRREALDQPTYQDRMAAERRFLVIVNDEDIAVNVMQQRGAATRAAVPGRFSHLEKALWQLADYVRDRLKD